MGRSGLTGLMGAFLLVAACAAQPAPARIEIIAASDATGKCGVTWNGKPLSPAVIADLKRTAKGRPVHIVGDTNVPYRCIGGAIYSMQAAGMGRIGFISEPRPARGIITVPAGECVPTVDGRQMTLTELRPVAEAWGKSGEDFRFQPDPRASYKCVEAVLQILKETNASRKMGFIGNEAYDPTQDDSK